MGLNKSNNVLSLGWEDPLKKGNATHTSIWLGEFQGLYKFLGRKELDMTERLSLSFSGGSSAKEPPANAGDVGDVGSEDPLEKGSATYSSILGLPWWLRL